MKDILVVLTCAPEPMLASEVARVVGRPPPLVRRSLSRLERDGLARRVRHSARGPIGTYRWGATPAGARAVEGLVAYARGGRADT